MLSAERSMLWISLCLGACAASDKGSTAVVDSGVGGGADGGADGGAEGGDTSDTLDPACVVVDGRPAGWTDATHGKAGDPDPSRFDTSLVREITLGVLAADRSAAAAWRSSLEAVFAVDEFLRWLAVNTVAENWDIYGGLAHNYYLYAVPSDGGRLHWVPWDHNLGLAESMRGASDPMQADVGAEWPLIHHLIADEVYFARYRALLTEALDGQAEPAAMTARSAELTALVAPELFEAGGEASNDPSLFRTEAAHTAAVSALLSHVSARRAEVEAALLATAP